ncbi:MAG: DUF2066 domain-containing protein [Proteobacteria bacterium]|nr:DUF2066 domain-containing protein [Pseudomonadota bacterium]
MRRAALTLAATWLLLPLLAQSARLVPVYTVDVAERGGAALQNAMRSALVRATGRREAADDPALAALVADAPRYVTDWTTGSRGQPQVLFDAAAIERAVTAAGRALWDPMRPLTLVVLDPARPRAAADAARAQLDRVAAERGLPINLVTLPLVDASGRPLSRDALLAAAQAGGGDQLLVGRGDTAAAALEWTLYTPTATAVPSWTGPLAAGVDHTVDVLAPQPTGAMTLPESTVHLRIDGVNTLTDYATVTRLLQATPGLRRVGIARVAGASATFDVSVRGGAAGLEPLLAAQPRFTRTASAVYLYVPASPAAAAPTP